MMVFLDVLSIVLFFFTTVIAINVAIICTIGHTTDRELKLASRWYMIWLVSLVFAGWRVIQFWSNLQ